MNKLGKIFIIAYSSIYYILTVPFFGKNHPSNFISLYSRVANKKNKHLGQRFIFRSFGQLRGIFNCGDDVRFGYNCHVMGEVTMGDYIMVAPNCVITGGAHGTEIGEGPMIFQKCPAHKPVVIGSDVWIGANSVILPGTNIGDGVIVGAGSVVRGNIPPYAIVAGNPAKVKRFR